MSIAPAIDIVHLWDDRGHPVRFGWRGRRYRITASDPLPSPVDHDALTHPAPYLTGWQLTAYPEDDPSEVVTVQVRRSGAGWILIDIDSN